MVWLRISIEGKWFATSHGSFLVIKPIPWILWLILTPSPLSIKACPFALGKLVIVIVSEFQRLSASCCKSLLSSHKAKSKQGDSCNQRERSLSQFPTSFARHVLLITQPMEDLTSELWLYSSLFINNRRLLLWFHSYCLLK